MKVRLKKATPKDRSDKFWPVGQVLVVTTEKGMEWVKKGYAEEYTGQFPPNLKKKQKINLSQLKT